MDWYETGLLMVPILKLRDDSCLNWVVKMCWYG